MTATIHLANDMVGFAVCLSLIFVGRQVRGVWGGLLVLAGLMLLVISGIDSLIKLFGDEWTFLERLYHFAWVWVGIIAFLLMRAGFKTATAVRRKEHDRD